ncbi:hypothetical protein CFY87_07810 [Actinobacillus seminis]|uniref:Uncharacterized protein n=1 Tax=Actinobacillus seminis TaxID=722 RepID=A0ABX4FL90_9PAST|nr:hypothetical protein [Actinobacillus seminis]OZN24615.1 hypothetical protein CFY87_07810 [Actinobacillus seminis]
MHKAIQAKFPPLSQKYSWCYYCTIYFLYFTFFSEQNLTKALTNNLEMFEGEIEADDGIRKIHFWAVIERM